MRLECRQCEHGGAAHHDDRRLLAGGVLDATTHSAPGLHSVVLQRVDVRQGRPIPSVGDGEARQPQRVHLVCRRAGEARQVLWRPTAQEPDAQQQHAQHMQALQVAGGSPSLRRSPAQQIAKAGIMMRVAHVKKAIRYRSRRKWSVTPVPSTAWGRCMRRGGSVSWSRASGGGLCAVGRLVAQPLPSTHPTAPGSCYRRGELRHQQTASRGTSHGP